MKYDNTGYGPILENLEEELSPYIKFSEQAYRFYIEKFSSKAYLLKDKSYKVFNWLLSNAKNSSFSIRLLSTWGQPIEGYALLRIRLEQLIVSSYLLHEDPEKGTEPYKEFEPIIEHDILKFSNTTIHFKRALTSLLPNMGFDNEEKMKDLKDQRERILKTYGDKKRKDKWTDYSTKKLAEERDKLVDDKDEISRVKLLEFYTLYKIASSIVHADSKSISPDFLTTTDDGIIIPLKQYIFTNLIMLPQLDIIQCYETSKRFKLNNDERYLKLFDKYIARIKKDYEL